MSTAKTDYDRLVLEIWTNGTINPADSLAQAAHTLEQFFHRFVDAPLGSLAAFGGLDGAGHIAGMGSGAPDARIEELDFSVRTYNCLKKANVLTIGELAQMSEGELMQIRNFGKKSLTEVKDKLVALGMSLKGSVDGETYDDIDDDVDDDLDAAEAEESEAETAEA